MCQKWHYPQEYQLKKDLAEGNLVRSNCHKDMYYNEA